MARFVTGNSFSTGDQVTATTLNNAVNNAKASTDSVDNSSIAVDGSGVLSVKTSTSASDGVTFAKFQQVPANTVLVRDANSLGSISAKAVADTQILIGDGTGFTSAALSGDATMTNAGAVTVNSVASGATGTTASSGDNSTKLATTAFVTNGFSPSSYTGEESVTLPNGLIMKMGISSSVSTNASLTVNFGAAFNAAPITIQLTKLRGLKVDGQGELTVDNVTASQFTIRNGLDTAGQVYWFAIGR